MGISGRRSYEGSLLIKSLFDLGFPGGSAGNESTLNAGDLGSIPGLGRSPGEGKGYPLQYSGLENSMDCIVHGVAKNRTRLSDFHLTSFMFICHFIHSFGALLSKSSFEYRWTNDPTHQIRQELFWHTARKRTWKLTGNRWITRRRGRGTGPSPLPLRMHGSSSLLVRSLVTSFALQILLEPAGPRVVQCLGPARGVCATGKNLVWSGLVLFLLSLG